jgi:hypothetical protein
VIRPKLFASIWAIARTMLADSEAFKFQELEFWLMSPGGRWQLEDANIRR